MPERLVCSALVLLLLSGCSGARREFEEAARTHRRSIAYVSAFAPFLQVQRTGQRAAAQRYAARMARMEIMKHALFAADWQAPQGQGGKEISPTERIARGFARLLDLCPVKDTDDEDKEWRRIVECRDGVRALDAALGREDQLAQRAGLPAGTIGRIEPASVNGEAMVAAEKLQAAVRPPPAEAELRRLWQDPGATDTALREACDAMLKQAQQGPPGVYDELSPTCVTLRTLQQMLLQTTCARADDPDCPPLSVCGLLYDSLKRSAELPAAYPPRVLRGISRCEKRQEHLFDRERGHHAP